MSRKFGKTAALLNKVNHHLKGEKVVEQDEDDGLGAYLSSLTKKTPDGKSNQPNWEKFGEEDLSISSNEDIKKSPKATVNKFLKKKSADPAESQSKFIKKSTPGTNAQASKLVSSNKSSALSKASAFSNKYSGAMTSKTKESIHFSDSDSDLNDMSLSMDEDVIKSLQKPSISNKSDKTVSEDSDLGKQGNSSKFVKSNQQSNQKSDGKNTSTTKGPSSAASIKNSHVSESDDDSFPLGKGGNKFLKKKPTNAQIEENIEEDSDSSNEPAKTFQPPQAKTKSLQTTKQMKKDMFSLKSAERYSTQLMMDSEDESLQNYIKGLSPSASPAPSPSPPASPARAPKGILKTPRTPTMEYISEEDESRTKTLQSLSEDEGSFKLNVMDLDALQPATLEPVQEKPSSKSKSNKEKKSKSREKPAKQGSPKKKEKPKTDDFFSSFGIQSVDDLLGGDDLEPISEAHTEGIITEIEDRYDSDFEPPSRSAPLRSILSPSPRPPTPKGSKSRVRLSLTDVREVRSPSPEPITSTRQRTYSADFDDESILTDVIKTETVHSDIIKTESVRSIASDTETDRTLSPSPRSSSVRRQKSEDYYSDDFTSEAVSPRRKLSRASSRESLTSYTEDFSGSSRSTSPEPVRKKVPTKSTQVQTGLDIGDLVYHWNDGTPSSFAQYSLGIGRDKPSSLASHIVGAEALEVLTSYSPSVIALNDMLRSQIQLTQQFLDMQKRLHSSLKKTTYPDHHYTTLEDTKRYIRKHKKPTLTFDEALRQVKEDMGLS